MGHKSKLKIRDPIGRAQNNNPMLFPRISRSQFKRVVDF